MSKRCLGCMEQYGEEFNICPHCGYVEGTPAEEAIHMEPGTLLYDRYIIGKVLGYGGFGVTYLAWDGKLEQKVAIKEYLPGEFSTRMPGQSQVTTFNGEKQEQFRDGLKKFVDEAKRLAKFQNEPGIVKIFDGFEENDTAYIVMEYLDGETLTAYLKRVKTIPEDDAVAMLTPVMESLQTVHEAGILHRDIAPDNIFLTKTGEVKLIDFGASRYATTSHSRSLTVIIKPGYSPEEQYRSRSDQGAHTDVYALSATLYKMVTGKTPPDAMERRAKYENQNKDILEEPHKLNKDISRNREVAMLNALNVRIEDRTPDVATFLKELNMDPPAKRIYGKIKKIDLYAWPLWVKILVPTMMVLLITFATLLLTGVIRFSRFTEEITIPEGVVTVPDVEGLYRDEALEEISKGQLLVSTSGSVESEYIPAGKIILQTPVGGSYMNKNGTVVLMVSSGKGVALPTNGISTVPFVVWDAKEDAAAKFAKAGLGAPIIVEVNDENVTYGSVIAQSIEAGKQVEEGTVITLTVSKGPASFAMPNVAGMEKAKAEELLSQKGLVVAVSYRKTDEVAEGLVVSQSVDSGKDVKRGDEIELVISSGRETIDVEDVTGKPKADAVQILKEQGFKVTVLENYDSVVASGKVISHTPEGSSAQLPGTEIVVYVSKGKKPIVVSYDAQGGTVTPANKSTYLSDAYGELPTPTKTGYSFEGWYSSLVDGVLVTSSTEITTPSNHTLYAKWKANTYKVSFNMNGGGTAPSAMTVTYDAQYGTLPTVSRTGYTFKGWYTATSGETQVIKDTVMKTASDMTLYAQWKANDYTVTLNANGGSVSSSSKTVTYDSTYGVPDATRTGYTFQGWYTATSGGTKVSASTKVTIIKDQTLYAQWTVNDYKVSWNTGTGYSISVKRTSSPNAGASTNSTLSNGAVIYYGDVLNISYTKADYYTISGNGATSITVTGDVTSSTIWATAKLNDISDWVLASSVPSGAQIAENKWTYTRIQTTESTNSSMSGWTQTGSYWNLTRSGSTNYATFHNGFDTSNNIYQTFSKSPYSAYDNGTTKREVSNAWAGYVYWHWMYDCGGANASNRVICAYKGLESVYTGYNYKYFGAFTSTTNYAYQGTSGVGSATAGMGVYKVTDRTSYASSQGSYRWYRFDYYTSTYTDYQKIYQYQKVTTGNESTTQVSAGGEISNVQHYVRYRAK